MRSSSLLILSLLVVAAGVVSLTMVSLTSTAPEQLRTEFEILWGIALAHVQLVTAALVFVRQGLLLRVSVLIACTLLWSFVVPTPTMAALEINNAIILLSAVIFTAGWCGALRFLGWRLVVGSDETAFQAGSERQFSLATLVIAMTTAGVYAGLLRYTEMNLRDFRALLVVVLQCSIVGSTLLTVMSHRAAWLIWAIPMAALFIARESTKLGYIISADVAVAIALPQSGFLGVSILVLNIAGVRLMRRPNRLLPSAIQA